MTFNAQSSGDLIADRRGDYARMFASSGDYQAAVELMEQALEICPSWAGGWFKLGEYAEKALQNDKAIEAYQTLQDLDKPGIFGASLKLAILGIVDAPDLMPSTYVAGLFDDYADRFDKALVGKLNYSVPQKLTALILEHSPKGHRFNRVIDLGCGTGLFADAFKNNAAYFEGYDISSNMLAKAEDKHLYSHLGLADLTLNRDRSGLFVSDMKYYRADLVASADVMMYLGQLDNVMALAEALLDVNGYFAFSIEEAVQNERCILQSTLRYAHSETYVREMLNQSGFELLEKQKTTIRTDGGKPILGILFLARKAE